MVHTPQYFTGFTQIRKVLQSMIFALLWVDPWDDDSGRGGQKHLCYQLGLYINDFKSDYSGIKSKCRLHIEAPSRRKKIAKN